MSSSSALGKIEVVYNMPPPPSLNKETLIIWEGWRKLGVIEVVRESVSKGSHLDLAYLFLSQRKQLHIEDTKKWFKEQVIDWVTKLVQNKQVFKATHILNNAKLDPFVEIAQIMVSEINSDNRNFLASHLEKQNALDANLKAHFDLLCLMEKDNDALVDFKEFYSQKERLFIHDVNLQMLLNCDNDWKSSMVASLFLKYCGMTQNIITLQITLKLPILDFNLTSFLTSKSLWDCMLTTNHQPFIQVFINVQYSKSLPIHEDDQLINLLLNMRITPTMISDLHTRTDVSEETKEYVYDLIAEHGDFQPDAASNVKTIVKRLSKNGHMDDMETIFMKPTAVLNFDQFKQLLIQYCIENKHFVVLDAFCRETIQTIPSDHEVDHEVMENDIAVALLNSCRSVATSFNNKHILAMNLQQINTFLHHTTPNTTRTEFNALLELFLMLMNGFDIAKTLTNNQLILEELPIMKMYVQKLVHNRHPERVSKEMLLRKHFNADISELLVHEENKECMNFRSEDLVAKYGKCRKLDYSSLLLHLQPAKALLMLDNNNLTQIAEDVRKLVIKHVQRVEILAACMIFLEELNISTEILKIEIDAMQYLSNKNDLTADEIQKLFFDRNFVLIIQLYENALMEDNNYIRNLDILDHVVKLAKSYECTLPTKYLSLLASESRWVEFIFIIHKYDYPHDQVNNLVFDFSDPVLYSHLSHALTHDLVYEGRNQMLRDRDTRKFFLARIGLLKQPECDMAASTTSQSSWGSNTSSGSSCDNLAELEAITDKRNNLLQVLIKCHNSNDPPKALLHACLHYKYPLLAVLATTYEPDSVIVCWLSWLSASCHIENENCEQLATVGAHVTKFLRTVVEHGYYKTLRQSFSIFLNENPIRIFMDFLCDCKHLYFNCHQHTTDLDKFYTKMKRRLSNSYVLEIDHEMLYLQNRKWIETTCITLLACLFNSLNDEPYTRVQLIQVLIKVDIQKYFVTELPDFTNLFNLFHYLYEHKIYSNVDFLKLLDLRTFKQEVVLCVAKMRNEGRYEEALSIATALGAKLDVIDSILIEKWKTVEENENYWLQCDREFRKYGLYPKMAVNFYRKVKVSDLSLQYKILTLAYIWCNEFQLQELNDIEMQMWTLFIKLSNAPINIDVEKPASYTEMNNNIEAIQVQCDIDLSPEEKPKLDAAIGKILNAGSVYQALRINKIFTKYSNINLEILELCYALAENITLPIQLTAKERLLLRKVKGNRTFSQRRKPLFSFRLSNSTTKSAASNFGAILDIEPSIQDTLSLLESLIEGLEFGFELGERIVMTYRISLNTDISYNKILLIEEPLNLLTNALKSNSQSKIEIAHDFFCIYNWNKQQVADFLSEQLVNSINASIKAKLDTYTLWDVNLDQEVHLILQLLPDSCSVLGNKLYTYCSALYKSFETITGDPRPSELILVIELLKLSHDCFTSDCNMEGISIVLKKAQTLINLLLSMKNWSLIVRILTCIGRYNELHFVFHILHENDQFEYLLRKGNTKDNALRVALLEYLKKYCPDNRSLYEMVALYFSLYSEVAQIWETDANNSIKNLIAISKLEMINRKVNPDECIFVELTNCEGTRMCLSKAMENYSHASEYHLQGEKLAKAMNAARQAELVALQLCLVKGLASNATTTCILHLTTSQISSILLTLNFQQAIIVSEAYGIQTDWAHALFEHYIVHNESKYLDQFLSTFNLTDGIIHNLSRHFLSKNVNNEISNANMKILLRLLPSIRTKYRIASELGYSDIVEELLSSEKLNYLKDTVWKQGYKE